MTVENLKRVFTETHLRDGCPILKPNVPSFQGVILHRWDTQILSALELIVQLEHEETLLVEIPAACRMHMLRKRV